MGCVAGYHASYWLNEEREDKKYDMVLVQMVLFPEFVTACNAKACLIIPRILTHWL
jgi:hypothetical protein